MAHIKPFFYKNLRLLIKKGQKLFRKNKNRTIFISMAVFNLSLSKTKKKLCISVKWSQLYNGKTYGLGLRHFGKERGNAISQNKTKHKLPAI